MTFFSTVLPTETALRVWDALFIRGADVLFRVSLALFQDARVRILSVARSSTTSTVQVRTLDVADWQTPRNASPPSNL